MQRCFNVAGPCTPELRQMKLASYLDRLGLDTGTLVVFDRRGTAAPLAEHAATSDVTHGGRTIRLLRL